MPPLRFIIVFSFCLVLLRGMTSQLLGAEPPAPLTFEQHIRPLLKVYCLDCHGGGDELQGKLDLRLRRFLVQGGESGAAIVVGKAEESLLLHRVESGEMPPGEKKMPAAEIAILRRWIATGAPTARAEPETLDQGIGITPEEREFWAFQPLVRPAPPAQVADPHRLRTPIDRWIAWTAQQQEMGGFSAEASAAVLLRRATFNLLGLPPSPEQLEQLPELAAAQQPNADQPDAWERLIDRLLASPRYGERWGRHWLDLAGYAESDGYTSADQARPYAYKYRDYVIRAFNADKPWNEFLVEQLAGDELLNQATTNFSERQIELLTATGFLRMAADGTGSGPPDQELARQQVITDTIKIVSSGLLGLSVHCAQCHNHRYDPIPQADYYRLRAVFEPALDPKTWKIPQQRLVSLYTDADRQRAAAVEAEANKLVAEKSTKQAEYLAAALNIELMKFPEPQRAVLREAYDTPADKRTPAQNQLLKENPSVNISPGVLYQYDPKAAEELKKYDERINAERTKKPVEDFVQALVETPGSTSVTHLLHRGDYRQPRQAVAPGDLTIVAAPGKRFEIVADDPQLSTSGRRLALARAWTSGTHPLVGRVWVNRIWGLHFGRAIVGTPGDFGVLGDRPSHPELLDWLAMEFPEGEWSVKRLHRQIMTSTVYRQVSQRDPQRSNRDDDNRYLTRMSVRRLDAEALRDRLLSASGSLRSAMFGPAVAVKEDDVGQVIVGGDEARRSVYVQVRRSQPLALLAAFDAPVMETNCDCRQVSTVATQSLMLMNSEFVLQQALKLATLIREQAGAERPTGFSTEIDQLAEQTERLRATRYWQYGTGRFDLATQRVVGFADLPHWTGAAWQGGPQLPDPQRNWAILHQQGGHPGNGQELAAIRRWTSPVRATIQIRGTLEHPAENGDGVRGRIVSSREGLVGEWSVKKSSVKTETKALAVEPGDTIDFIADCRDTVESDSFTWNVELQPAVELDAKAAAGSARPGGKWNSATGFQGPSSASKPLLTLIRTAWQRTLNREPSEQEYRLALAHFARQWNYLQTSAVADKPGEPAVDLELRALSNLCQVLMNTNEFLYVE
jgi:hypothetical protein